MLSFFFTLLYDTAWWSKLYPELSIANLSIFPYWMAKI